MERTITEIANDLVLKYFKTVFKGANKIQDDFEWERSKECALVCVDLIIEDSSKSLKLATEMFNLQTQGFVAGGLVLWTKVRKEIEKL